MGDVLNRGSRERPRWYCRYVDVDGKRKQKATRQTTRVAAERYLAELEARIARGQAGIVELTPAERARKTVTIGELATRFLDEYAPPRIKSIKNYRRDARSVLKARILPALRARAAASIGTHDIERFRDSLAAEPHRLAPASIVQTLAVLSKLYNWARRAGLVDCANPVQGVERPRLQHSIDFLSQGEIAQLLATADELARSTPSATIAGIVRAPMVATAIYCGLRKGELFGLRWSDVALDAARLDVNRSYELLPKSGKPRHVPMHPELVRIVRAWKKACPGRAKTWCSQWSPSPAGCGWGSSSTHSGSPSCSRSPGVTRPPTATPGTCCATPSLRTS